MTASLPTPRETLTSLIAAISKIPTSSSPPTEDHVRPPQVQQGSNNPLSQIPVSARPLLTTLHVLFPSHVLPALDLLDRGLVTHVVLAPPPSTTTTDSDDAAVPEQEGEGQAPKPSSSFYIVRSAAASSTHHQRRRKHHHNQHQDSGAGDAAPAVRSYVVRLRAWNCTCAAFAFSAFPAATPPSAGPSLVDDAGGEGRDGDQTAWEFGGMSLDGLRGDGGGGPVPCCKHLLACVLAERWSGALGRYVGERRVGKEEMAGIIADV